MHTINAEQMVMLSVQIHSDCSMTISRPAEWEAAKCGVFERKEFWSSPW